MFVLNEFLCGDVEIVWCGMIEYLYIFQVIEVNNGELVCQYMWNYIVDGMLVWIKLLKVWYEYEK